MGLESLLANAGK